MMERFFRDLTMLALVTAVILSVGAVTHAQVTFDDGVIDTNNLFTELLTEAVISLNNQGVPLDTLEFGEVFVVRGTEAIFIPFNDSVVEATSILGVVYSRGNTTINNQDISDGLHPVVSANFTFDKDIQISQFFKSQLIDNSLYDNYWEAVINSGLLYTNCYNDDPKKLSCT